MKYNKVRAQVVLTTRNGFVAKKYRAAVYGIDDQGEETEVWSDWFSNPSSARNEAHLQANHHLVDLPVPRVTWEQVFERPQESEASA